MLFRHCSTKFKLLRRRSGVQTSWSPISLDLPPLRTLTQLPLLSGVGKHEERNLVEVERISPLLPAGSKQRSDMESSTNSMRWSHSPLDQVSSGVDILKLVESGGPAKHDANENNLGVGDEQRFDSGLAI